MKIESKLITLTWQEVAAAAIVLLALELRRLAPRAIRSSQGHARLPLLPELLGRIAREGLSSRLMHRKSAIPDDPGRRGVVGVVVRERPNAGDSPLPIGRGAVGLLFSRRRHRS